MENGLKSIFFTIIVFFLLILSYGLLGFLLFAENDPFHFGTYALSVVTFFQLSTFENWSVIYYLNYGGCDSIPSEYPPPQLSNVSAPIHTVFGTLSLPVCVNPQAQPGISTVIFCSYAFLAGYVLVSMCLAAVALGVNEKLDDLMTVSLYGDLEDETSYKTINSNNAAGQGSKASKLLGSQGEAKAMKELLKKIWLNQGVGAADGLFKSSTTSFKAESSCSFSNLVEKSGSLIKDNYYKIVVSLIMLADAILRIISNSNNSVSPEDSDEVIGIHLFFQCLLLIDVLIQLFSQAAKPWEILKK